MNAPDAAPKESAELLHFLCLFGKVVSEAYSDDGRIGFTETLAMVGLLREAGTAFTGLNEIGGELVALTPEQMRKLADIPAEHFRGMIPAQHEAIALAAMACLPSLTNLFQTIRNAAALSADFPGARRALPA